MLAYLEDAPADNGSAVRGLSKAIVPLLRCLDDEFDAYIVNQTHTRLPADKMPSFVRNKLIETNTQGKIVRNAWKLATVLPLSMTLAIVCLFVPRPARGILPRDNLCLWVPIGIDPGTLVRAWCLARRIRLPLHLYFVDDIETHPSNVNTKRLGRLVAKIVRDASRVYTITAELGALFTQRYGVKTRRLPLIPEMTKFTKLEPSAAPQASPFFAVYLGSINHLYEDGIRHFIDAVRKLRVTTGHELELRLFSDPVDVSRVCGGEIPTWVTAGPEKDDAVLRCQIESASFCFLPYSFHEDARSMVATSFPSKLLDYLIDARAIVIFAPEYSIAHKTLYAEGIPHVVHTPEALACLLTTLATSNGLKSNQNTYRSLLARRFGTDTVKRALCAPW
ncbi:hypothetical protein [Loktanella salsilacus]|uniref:hypothetical protein n=1 Tax=Loktanella salsilacus TaxID=195913 RepID=UPI0030F84B49